MARATEFASNLLLAPLLAALLVAAARRQRMPALWPCVGIGILALLALHMQVVFPAAGRHGGHLGIGPALMMLGQMTGGDGRLLLLQTLLTVLPAAGLAGKPFLRA